MIVAPDDGNRITAHFRPRKEFDRLNMARCVPHFPPMSPTTSRTRAFFTKVEEGILGTMAILPFDIERIIIERNFFGEGGKLRVWHFYAFTGSLVVLERKFPTVVPY